MTHATRYRGNARMADGRPALMEGDRGEYVAPPALARAVEAALIVEMPLLVTGEAGTGKTSLAYSIAAELDLGKVESFTVRSDSQGRDVLYQVDNLQRFYDAQVKDPRAEHRRNYVQDGPLVRAMRAEKQRVVLIDEVDKAPRDFPNDLLDVLDRMELQVPELGIDVSAINRPIVVITSNRESQLPDPFLRRCVFCHVSFPSPEILADILQRHLSRRRVEVSPALRDTIVRRFLELRAIDKFQKKPATGELLAWARVLLGRGITAEELAAPLPELPDLCALIKTVDDLELVRQSRQ